MIFALAITGPTASGKTALSLSLADRLSAEIISCDSMQIYQGMDIGTAKATVDERALVPHHLIDFLSPTESYSVEEYRTSAIALAKDITERGKLPLFVGGTGLYIDSSSRNAYCEGVSMLRKLINYGGRAEVERIINEQKSRSPRRPALIDELSKLDKELCNDSSHHYVQKEEQASDWGGSLF